MTTLTKASAFSVIVCLAMTGCSSGAGPGTTPTAGTASAAAAATTSAATSTPAGGPKAAPADAAPAAGARDACALVTEQDAATALGADPGKGSAFSSHGSTQCQYGSYQSVFLLVNLTPTNGRAGYDMVRNNRKPGGEVTVADLAGVGDRAFQVSGHNTAGIFFNQGDAVVAISLSVRTATTPPLADALTLARIAAGRLQAG